MRSIPSEQFAELLRRAKAALTELKLCKPAFTLRIGWADDYSKLFGNQVDVRPEQSVLENLLKMGRVILSGRGGCGKTQLLRRVAHEALKSGILPVIIDLREWSSDDYREWTEWSQEYGGGGTFLLSRFSHPTVSPKELSWLPPSKHKLFLVDGLNELTESAGLQIVNAIDRFAQSQLLASVLITDRLVRRELPLPHRFALGLVMPLSDEVIRKYASLQFAANMVRGLFDSPYFLDAALRKDELSGGRSAIHAAYFRRYARLNETQLDCVASAAYHAYELNKARTFEFSMFEAEAGIQSTAKLLQERVIIRRNRSAHFSHHLRHDYLAARCVSHMDASEWTSRVLDTLSFEKSSFDAIALVIEHLPEDLAEMFLQRVYDWELYAAGYALAEGISAGQRLHPEMQTVILAMLAEKCFDDIEATRRKAADAIALVPSSTAESFQKARSLNDVFNAVGAVPSAKPWYTEWQELFARPANIQASDVDLAVLESPNSIMGWTMANVLRRTVVTTSQQAILRMRLAESALSVVRWRIAHVLGAFPIRENVEVLLQRLDEDAVIDVRYGAVRSLAESAAHGTQELREFVEEQIRRRIPDLMKSERLVAELTRGLIVIEEKAPEGWGNTVLRIGKELFDRAPSTEQMDRWRSYVADASRRYGLLD